MMEVIGGYDLPCPETDAIDSDKSSGHSEGDVVKNPVTNPSQTSICKPKPNGLRGSNSSTSVPSPGTMSDISGNESGWREQVPSDSNPGELSKSLRMLIL